MSIAPNQLITKVVDLLPDTVCVLDSEGHFVFVSAACERLLGYTQEELIGYNMIDLVFPEDRERTLQAAEDIMRGHPRTNFENRYMRKDGRVVHIMWSARWSDSDRIRVAVARDITELKNNARIQSALYQISEAAHVADGLFMLCKHIHQIIGNLLPADNFFVALYDESSDTLSFPYFVDEQKPGNDPQLLGSGTPISEVIHTGQALLMNYRDTGAIWDTQSESNRESMDWLGVPLLSQKGIIGALVVQSYSGSVRYTEKDKDLLQFVSTQVTDAIERKQTEAQLRHMAGHDALTDLPNRTLFRDRFDMALKRARRDKEHLALLYLDLDGFKRVNDTLGHEAGDQVLREMARRLTQCVREADTIGRRGGDEFTVLLTNIQGKDNVDIVVEKIHAAINVPFEFDGRTLIISASIGTAIYPEQGDEIEKLFLHADARMYAAKQRRS